MNIPQEDSTIRERFLRVALVDVYAQACLGLVQHGQASLQEALILCVEEHAKFHQYMMTEVSRYNHSQIHPMRVPVSNHIGDSNEMIANARAHLMAVVEAARHFKDYACQCATLLHKVKCGPCSLRNALDDFDSGKGE